VRRAKDLIARGEYAKALVELHALRQAESPDDRIDLATGVALLRRGEVDRAEPHLERYLERARDRDAAQAAEALIALGDVYRARNEYDRALAAFTTAREDIPHGGELWTRCLVGLASLACTRGNFEEGLSLAHTATTTPDATPSAHVAAHLALASCHRGMGDIMGAERAARTALKLADSLPRELAEAYIAYAHLVGESEGVLDSVALGAPAVMLARAQELLREHGSLADLERVREAFQRFGRRATDRVTANQIRSVINELRQARATISRETHKLVDAVQLSAPHLTSTALDAEREIDASLQTMSTAEGRALAATQAMISERETIRILLDLVRTLNQIDDYRKLLAESCRMAAQLAGADRALLAIANRAGMLEVREALHIAELDELTRRPSSPDVRHSSRDSQEIPSLAHHTPSHPSRPTPTDLVRPTPWPERPSTPALDPHADTPWRRALDLVLQTRRPTLIESESARGDATSARGDDDVRLGTALVAPLRVGNHIIGAIYVDKELCGGLFTSQDLDLLALFTAQVSTMLQNVRSSEELRLAARSRAATLEAISDGVLSLDRAGLVTSINARAARILGVAPNAKPNLALFPDLSFLRAVLDRGEEIDGRVSRIGAAEYVINARIVRSDQRDVAGVVVTLTEMKRAKSIAQRIAGSHARYSFADLIGEAATLRAQLRIAEAASRSDSTVLITGESGTGKEVIAQAIHNASGRTAGPFVGINCSAIPRELLESELFGYESGAFTGARRGGQPGKFELAEGGTILLDEIGDMPLEMQAKLLRVLQERRVRRIGAAREVSVDARVIATTNRDLDDAAARGQFRADLLFRLKVIHIALPSLRERASDIPILVEHFLHLFAARLGKQVRGVAPGVMAAFQRYGWPGNIRELENVLEAEVNLIDPEAELLEHVPDALRKGASSSSKRATQTFEEAERELLVQALARHGGSIPDVARTLGISRGTVYNKLHRYGIDPDAYRDPER
jgi:transcriptional regulator with PAS, ATPase and Fis domain/tetratricopeptide (TPR) repeat protein